MGGKNCHGEKNKTISPMQRLEAKSGCAVPSVVNGEVLRGGSLSLVPRRPEAVTHLLEANCERNIMWRAKGGYLDALISLYFSKTIHQISVNCSFPLCSMEPKTAAQPVSGCESHMDGCESGTHIPQWGRVRVTSLVQILESKPQLPYDQG